MKTFVEPTFLLQTKTAKDLYERYAKDLPIIDYHCHLKAEAILNDIHYENITKLWLDHDHYKWRLMRANGVEEKYITGDGTDREKFDAWIETIQHAIGNPLYYWTHMELNSFFGIEEEITLENSDIIWNKCNAQLGVNGKSVRDFIEESNVSLIGTTDDPCSNLAEHQAVNKLDLPFKIIPTYRMDKILNIENIETYKQFIAEVELRENMTISTYEDLMAAVEKQIDYFMKHGMKSADLGQHMLFGEKFTRVDTIKNFSEMLKGSELTTSQIDQMKTMILVDICKKLHQHQLVFQFHFGALGSINDKAHHELGKSTGFDTITDQGDIAKKLIILLNEMDKIDGLPKIIFYNIDGTKNDLIMSIISAFQNEPGIKSKMQLGSAWWFQDTKEGIEKQLTSVATQGMLNNFIGMLTDSRSFLSYQRHDFFRRILCNRIGDYVEQGEATKNEQILQQLIENVCYKNAETYFNLRSE